MADYNWSTLDIFFLLWGILSVIGHVIIGAAFWEHRSKQPIKARHPRLVTLTMIIAGSYTFLKSLQVTLREGFTCGSDVFIGTLILMAASLYLCRTWLLFFVFNLTAEKVMHARENMLTAASGRLLNLATEANAAAASASEPSKTAGSTTVRRTSGFAALDSLRNAQLEWFLAHRWLIEPKFLLMVFGSLWFVMLLNPIVFAAADADNAERMSGDDDCNHSVPDTVTGIFFAFIISSFLYLSLQLRVFIGDGFYIRDELRRVAYTALVAVVLWLPLQVIPAARRWCRDTFALDTMVVLIAEHACFYFTVYMPLYLAHHKTSAMEVKLPGQESVSSLEKLLQVPEGVESFREFVQREFSVENLLFWEAVRDFKERFDIARRKSAVDADLSDSSDDEVADRSTGPLEDASVQRSSSNNSDTSLSASLRRMLTLNRWTSGEEDASKSKKAKKPKAGGDGDDTSVSASASREVDITDAVPGMLNEDQQMELYLQAIFIFEEYISRGSPLEVNLPHNIVLAISEALDQPIDPKAAYLGSKRVARSQRAMQAQDRGTISGMSSSSHSLDVFERETTAISRLSPEVFDAAQRTILDLMRTDSWPRYFRSPLYRDLIEKLRVNEGNKLVLAGLSLI